MKLDIQRFAVTKSTTFTESNISIENNTSSLKITIEFSANNDSTYFSSETLTCTCNGVTKSAQVSHPRYGSAKKSFTFNNIKHNSDGTKTVEWSWSCATGTNVLKTVSDNGRRTLTKINRYAYIKSILGNTTDSTIAITYESTNDNYEYFLEIIKGDYSTRNVYKSYYNLDSSVGEHTLNVSVESNYFNDYTNSTNAPITYALWTDYDVGLYANPYNATINLNSSVVPSVTIGTLLEADAAMQDLNWGIFVQNKSKLEIPIIANGIYGSDIVSIVTNINGNIFNGSNIITPVLVTSGTSTITTTVTDSRGRTATTTTTYSVEPYSNPSITSVEAQRCLQDGTIDEDGTYVLYTFVGSITSVENHNSKIFQIGYKKTTDENYTFATISNIYSVNEQDSVSTFTISPDYAYDIIFQAVDSFMTTALGRELTVGFDLMNFNASGKAMAIGKVSEAGVNEELLEIDLPLEVLQPISGTDASFDTIEFNSNDLEDLLFYKSGVVVEIGSTTAANMLVLNGFITSSSSRIFLTIFTNKNLSNINTITINQMELEMRSIQGYIEGSGFHDLKNMTNVSVSADKSSDYTITLLLEKTNGWKNPSNANTTNNTPVSVNGYIELSLT